MTPADAPAGGPDRAVTRVSAYALCTDADRLLSRIAPGPWTAVGRWTLPGGGIDFGEPPRDAALRELTEETGLVGEIDGLATPATRDGGCNGQETPEYACRG